MEECKMKYGKNVKDKFIFTAIRLGKKILITRKKIEKNIKMIYFH